MLTNTLTTATRTLTTTSTEAAQAGVEIAWVAEHVRSAAHNGDRAHAIAMALELAAMAEAAAEAAQAAATAARVARDELGRLVAELAAEEMGAAHSRARAIMCAG